MHVSSLCSSSLLSYSTETTLPLLLPISRLQMESFMLSIQSYLYVRGQEFGLQHFFTWSHVLCFPLFLAPWIFDSVRSDPNAYASLLRTWICTMVLLLWLPWIRLW